MTEELNEAERIILPENFKPPGDGQPTRTGSLGSRSSNQSNWEELPIQFNF